MGRIAGLVRDAAAAGRPMAGILDIWANDCNACRVSRLATAPLLVRIESDLYS